MINQDDDNFDGIIGGRELPADRIRTDVQEPGKEPRTETERKILRLFALYPQLRGRFDEQAVEVMDDEDRQLLLEQMCQVLNLVPLREGGAAAAASEKESNLDDFDKEDLEVERRH